MKRFSIILLLLATIKMSAETPTFFPRKFLLEHFTSANCNQCPMGMKYIVDYLDWQTTPYIWVSHHAVYGTDEYTLPESNELAMNYLGIYSVPSVVFNRTEQQGSLAIGAWDLESWNIEERKAEDDTLAEASIRIDHHFDAATRQLDITVNGQVANIDRTEYLLNILIKENRLVGEQADAFTSWKCVDWREYMHPRVVRDFVTGTFGDTVHVTNQAYQYSISYTLNSEWIAENCCIVAYLTPLEKKPIINAEQAAIVKGTLGGEEYGPYGVTESKGPNASISFDSVRVSKVADNQLEIMLLSSKTIQSRFLGICKQVGFVYVNTEADVLQPGTYTIQEGNVLGAISAGYRVDEEETLGGSRLIYALSSELKNGNIVPIHQWRMNTGEMTLNQEGNISLDFTTYNGTSVTATALYDFSPATGVEEVQGFRSSGVKKVLHNGQLLIEKDGVWYTILGYRL